MRSGATIFPIIQLTTFSAV